MNRRLLRMVSFFTIFSASCIPLTSTREDKLNETPLSQISPNPTFATKSPHPVFDPTLTMPPYISTTPVLEETLTGLPPSDYEIVQIGIFDPIHLRYDPSLWEAFNEQPDQLITNKDGEPVEALRHRAIAGCSIRGNLGMGAPTTWRREDTNSMIGNLQFRVESWTDKKTENPVLIVYQYPIGKSGYGVRIELRIDEEPELCIELAEEILILSEDLILESASSLPGS